MRIQGKFWSKKGKKKVYQGSYAWFRGERQFCLLPVGGGKQVVYESHEEAKKCGWVKVKNA